MILRRIALSRQRPAAAAVEAAVVLPVFIFFAGAVLDLGRLAKAHNCVSNAARNGAQIACVTSTAYLLTSQIRSAAMTEMSGLPGVKNTSPYNPTVTATAPYTGSDGNKYTKVTVSYDMTGTGVTTMFPVNNITKSVEMRLMP